MLPWAAWASPPEATGDVAPTLREAVPLHAPPARPARTAPDARRSPADFSRDRILVAGGSREAIGLLHLAAVRSDDVLLLAEAPDEPTLAAAERLGAAHRSLEDISAEFGRAAAVLVAEGRPDAREALAAAARALAVPVFVTGRPDLSDFTLLDLLERRSCSRAGAAAP